jgi:L-lactate dehydrogenase complex protein LldG
MEESTSREKVLKKVRNALISKTENPFPSLDLESPVFSASEDSTDVTFAQEFSKVSGKFVYCEDQDDLKSNLIQLIREFKWQNIYCLDPELQDILKEAAIPFLTTEEEFTQTAVGFTKCEFLIARTGSIMISSRQVSGRRLNVFPEIHVIVAGTSQIVADLKDALKKLQEKYNGNLPSLISVITGPSRTADIEKTLVMGAHGPKQLYLFLIDEGELYAK